MTASSDATNGQAANARHVRLGYLSETWGEVTLDTHDQPHTSGPRAEALQALYVSVTQQPAYRGLTPPQILARLTQRMRGPVWAIRLDAPEDESQTAV